MPIKLSVAVGDKTSSHGIEADIKILFNHSESLNITNIHH
jgi:hypothetical protein